MKLARIILLCVWGAVAGCGNKYNAEIDKIDSVLNNVRIFYDIGKDTTELGEKHRELQRLFAKVIGSYRHTGDTLYADEAMLMADCSRTITEMETVLNRYRGLDESRQESRQQLKDLRHDLEHKLLEPNFVNDAMKAEITAIDKITQQNERLGSKKDSLILKYSEYKTHLESLIMKIQKQP